jgi:hypothetical protein
MFHQLTTVLIWTLSAILSGLAALFFVFQVLFTDSSGPKEEFNAVAYVFLAYLGLAAFLSFLRKGRGATWFWILAIPATAVIVLLSVSEPGRPVYHVGVFLAVVSASWLGPRLVARLRKKPV